MTACATDIEYRGFRIDGNNTVYTVFPAEIPFNVYYTTHPSVDAAKKYIDHMIDLVIKNPIKPRFEVSNLCQEIVYPQIEDGQRLNRHKKMMEFKHYMMRNYTIHTLMLAHEPDIQKWFITDPDTGEFSNEMVYMLYTVYTNKF